MILCMILQDRYKTEENTMSSSVVKKLGMKLHLSFQAFYLTISFNSTYYAVCFKDCTYCAALGESY